MAAADAETSTADRERYVLSRRAEAQRAQHVRNPFHVLLYQHLARISNPPTRQKDVQTRSSDELGETYVVGGLLKTTIYQRWLRKVDVNRGRGYL